MSSLQQLLACRQALEQQQAELARQIDAASDAQRDEVIRNIKTLMSNHGLTLSDVLGEDAARHRSSRSGVKVAPKYRDPATGQTWSGRGLQPNWLKAAMAGGKSLADFAL